MSVVYVIPTWDAALLLADRSVSYLERSGVPFDDVLILVVPEQRAAYEDVLPPEWRERIRDTVPGLSESRRYAEEHYLTPGDRVIWINDDVRSIRRRVDDFTTEEVPVGEVAEEGFRLARLSGARLWGVYPLVNARWMKNRVRTNLRHIVGAFYGVEFDGDPTVAIHYGDAKEDYERSLRYYSADGAVVRIDFLGVDTTYYNKRRGDPIGGRFASKTPETVAANVAALMAEWPGHVQLNARRKSAFPEILLRT